MAAKGEFAEGVREVRILLASADMTREDEPDEAAIDRANAARRASVVLLAAHFESFLKSIALDFVDHLSSGVLESRMMPSGLRDLYTMSAVKMIQESGSLEQRSAHFRRLDRVAVLWKDDAKPPPGTLKAELLSKQVTSAKPEKIDLLFHLMGGASAVCDGDIDVEVPSAGLTTLNIRLGLTDVIGCRDAIAHGDSTRKPTSEDVDRYVAFLVALADRLDRKAASLKGGIMPGGAAGA